MSNPFDFVTRTDTKLGLGTGSKAASHLSDAALHRLGLKGVAGMNPRAHSIHLEPSGPAQAQIYVLTACPTPEEDADGAHGGEAAAPLRRAFQQVDDGVRYNCVVRTMPRKVKYPVESLPREQVECYRRSVVEDIERTKPAIIMGGGRVPLDWMLGPSVATVWEARGRRFPVRVGEHVCWFYPVEDPMRILKEGEDDAEGGEDELSGTMRKEMFLSDLRRITRDLFDGLPVPKVADTSKLEDGITILTGKKGDAEKLRELWHELRNEPALAHDIESNCLRPYSKGAKLLSLAFGTSKKVVAFAIDHPQAQWSRDDREVMWGIFLAFCHWQGEKIAHNLRCDMEWELWQCLKLWGRPDDECAEMARVLQPGGVQHCTMVQAYHLDERRGSHGLNFCTAWQLGFTLKTETELDKSNLENEPLEKVLMYNGMDAKYTARVHRRQMATLESEGLTNTYLEFVERIPSIVAAQYIGLPVDQAVVQRLAGEYDEKIQRYTDKLQNLEDVQRFKKINGGKFSPLSTDDVTAFYRDFLKRREGSRAHGKYSTDESVLKAIGDDAARLILKVRKTTKAKSTYIGPLILGGKDSVVFPDGRVHTNFNPCFAATGRLSSDDPNMQNYPKRNPETKKIRAAFVAPPGYTMVSVDYGQIEARVIAMMSQDPALVKSFWDDTDTHLHWAKKIVKVYPHTFKRRYSELPEKDAWKAFRGDVKNQFVFPCFFGSSLKSGARNLEMPADVLQPVYDEFWDEFNKVRTWQDTTGKFYKKHGYVPTLTGRRRRAPLTWNKIINSGVQGSATDLMVNAWNRLRRLGLRTGRVWLCPVIQIHDDLTFFVPTALLAQALRIITKKMCTMPFAFVNVPIAIEISTGSDWYSMADAGKFQSNRLE